MKLERFIDNIRNKEEKAINYRFLEEIKWTKLLYSTSSLDKQNVIESLLHIKKAIDQIGAKLIEEGDRVFSCREKIDKRLNKEINDLKTQLEDFNKEIRDYLIE